MQVLDETLITMHDELSKGAARFKSDYDHGYRDNDSLSTVEFTRVRLDFEYPSEDLKDYADSIVRDVRYDLEDLFVDGDRKHPNDPLLKVIDGEVVRNQRAVWVDIFEWLLYTQFSPMKDAYEYTIFCNIAFIFEDYNI